MSGTLKLKAEDKDDLVVLSSLLQDSVLKVQEMSYLPSANRFAAVFNRFIWEGEGEKRKRTHARVRSGLHFDTVRAVKAKNVPFLEKDHVLELLAIEHSAGETQDHILLTFAGGGQVRLDVEAIDVQLCDMGMAWVTKNKPAHPDT